ncbi:MAG: hypothetical protein ACTSUB_06505 [Candidatus Thorarchaeota archaeon]
MFPVYAAHSQGFSWGVSEGDTINFRLVYERNIEPTFSKNEAYYVIVGELPVIPDPVSSINTISAPCAYFKEDNTSFVPHYDYPLCKILPTGNWGVFTTYMEDTYEEITIDDDPLLWGYTRTDIVQSDRRSLTVQYEKNTGIMTSLVYEDKEVFGGDINESFEVTKIGIPGIPMDLVPIFLIGVVIVIGLVCASACLKKK